MRRGAVFAALIAACALSKPQLPDRSRAGGSGGGQVRPSNLNVWIMTNGEKSEEMFLDTIAPFALANPNVKVVLTVLPWPEAWEKIQAALKGGPAPDVVQMGTTWVASIAATGKLLDLTGKFDESVFPSGVLAATSIQGSGKPVRFAMPWFVDTRALYYNKAACAKAGIEPEKDFATWTSFKAALLKLKGLNMDGKRLLPLGFAGNPRDAVHNLSWWIWGAGGDFAIGLVREGLMVPTFDEGKGEVLMGMLHAGEVATIISYPISSLSENRFGVAPLPEGPRGRFTFLGGSTLAVFNTSQHQKESIALLKFLSSESAQLHYSARTGLLPAAARQYDDLLLRMDPVRSVLVGQLQYGRAYPAIPQWVAIEHVLQDGLGVVWDIATRPDPYDKRVLRIELDRLARTIDAILWGQDGSKTVRRQLPGAGSRPQAK
jgi:multiple sugar transport system substrate-binding protein